MSIALVAVVLAAPATAQQLNTNLIVNGDAEAQAADPDCNGPTTIPGWTTTANYADCSYLTGGGFLSKKGPE